MLDVDQFFGVRKLPFIVTTDGVWKGSSFPSEVAIRKKRYLADRLRCSNRAILLLLLIARSKLIPDFALTLHGLHLLLTWVYSGALPANALWWGIQVCSAALMVGLGMWACQWRELRPINFGGGKGQRSSDIERRTRAEGEEGSGDERDGGAKVPGDEERGWWGRGRGRGQEQDSGGSRDGYEMVGLRDEG
jgi:hypothetical protein